MRRQLKKALALLCTLIMLASALVFVSEGLDKPDSSPGGGDTETTTTVTYDYVYFGSYPQTEIVSSSDNSGVYGKPWATESDYIVDSGLYNQLENLSSEAWDSYGDTTIDGSKYRRIKEDDATKSESTSDNYYSWSDSETYHYFKYEPIKWRVLEQNGSDYFLLSEIALDDQPYNKKITGSDRWENCTVRSWLNGYDSSENIQGVDYTGDNFLDTAFTSDEQSKIQTTHLINNDNSKNGTEGGNDTDDEIYLLSEDEVYGENAVYGFAEGMNTHDLARQAESSTYAKAMGTSAYLDEEYIGNCDWWLRTPGSEPGLTAIVQYNGRVSRGGEHDNSGSRGIRPVMHVSLRASSTGFNSFDVSKDTASDSYDATLYIINAESNPITVMLAAYDSDGRFCWVKTETVNTSGYVPFTVDNSDDDIASLTAFLVTDLETASPLVSSETVSLSEE